MSLNVVREYFFAKRGETITSGDHFQANSKLPLLGIQYLRGIAALMVAYYHLANQLPTYDGWFKNYFIGNMNFASGVDIFFVVSGFIMIISSANDTPWDFFQKRLIRIVPLYWIITLFIVLGYFMLPSMFRTTLVTTEFLLKSLLFIPYQNPGHGGDIVPILVPGWSLNFEMAFYIVFTLSLLFPVHRRVMLVGLVFAVALAASKFISPVHNSLPFSFYLQPRLAEFWLGMLIGEMVRLKYRNTIYFRACVVIAIICVAALLTPEDVYSNLVSHLFSEVIVVISSGLLIFAVVSMERQGQILKLGSLKQLGDASYSIYLSHIFSFGVVRSFWVKANLNRGEFFDALAFILVSMLVAIFVGRMLFLYLEKPLLNLMKNMVFYKPQKLRV